MKNHHKVALGACLARSNYGLPRPCADEMRPLLADEKLTAVSATESLFLHYLDSDSSLDIFLEETWLWIERIRRRGDAILDDHPWLREVLA